MELTDRKKKVLFSIINEYVHTAQPVGSKIICEKYMPDVSSATVRNEMADLTQMGLILQPHTSAGRVPSRKGYRCFVDVMTSDYELSTLDERKIERTFTKRVTQLEKLMVAVTKQVSEMTGLATIITMPSYKDNKVKRFELIGIDDYSFVLVVVAKNGVVKTKVFRCGEVIDENALMKISAVLNRRFENLSTDKMTLPVILSVQKELDDYRFILPPILQFIYETVEGMDKNEVILEGATKIFDYPEFQDAQVAKDIFDVFEDKEALRSMLVSDYSDEIEVIIGDENKNPLLKKSTMVIGNYKIGNIPVGSICVVGPIRMDYGRVVSQIDYFTNSLNRLLAESFYEPDEALKRLLGEGYDR